jgi:hypothetical protein
MAIDKPMVLIAEVHRLISRGALRSPRVNVGSFLEFLHPNALLHPQPSPDLAVSLALEYGGFQIGQDGGQRAAAITSLIVTAKMNDIDPQAWLADTLARIAEHPAQRLDELLPWNWKKDQAEEPRAA